MPLSEISNEKKQKNIEMIRKLNQAGVKLSANQEVELVADYDAAYQEWKTKNQPYQIKFNGKTFSVPREQPFAYALFISRHTKAFVEGGKKVVKLIIPDDKAYEYVRVMLGDEFIEELDKSDVELSFVMNYIVPDIHKKWQGEPEQDAVRKNAQTPGS